MQETREVKIDTETSKNVIIDTSASINNLDSKAESITVKPKPQQSKFESYIVSAYKKLVGFDDKKPEPQKLDKKSQKELKAKLEEEERLKVSDCESELRKAIAEAESAKNVFLNKNIIDKTSRIYKRNKINLSLVIGEIYIQLMNKQNLFSKLNQKNSLDKNIIITFINEVINMNSLLKKTYLCFKYENTLFNFLESIIKEIAFDSEQLNEINVVLQEHKSKKDAKKLNT